MRSVLEEGQDLGRREALLAGGTALAKEARRRMTSWSVESALLEALDRRQS